ncbi:hypothetical protein CWE09_09735 [Aliidiomarina minuta]|uniref:DUF945 domain-containing protein n=1 Tax=Aliidiomarina minuta TaxID=880057 RepID=A0A432WA80_9GAMM|nr:DUF945 family protein [Aliidiomarina minuta]RUO26951.1 hypothetical protein CWE09_09735 [Aliidiomarina minuta]
MKSVFRWLLPLAVVVILVYLFLVWLTGSQTRQVAAEQVAAFQESNPQFNADLSWQREGFWSSEATLRMTLDVPEADLDESFVIQQPMHIRHSVLRSFVTGELEVSMADEDLIAMVFGDQVVRVEGTLGLGGVSFDYQVPAVDYQIDDVRITAEASQIQVVFTQDEQHSRLHLPSLNFQPLYAVDSDTNQEGLFVSEVVAISQTRLENGEPSEGSSEFRLLNMRMITPGGHLQELDNLAVDVHFQRELDVLNAQQKTEIGKFSYGDVEFTGELEMNVTNLPYDAFTRFSRSPQSEEDIQHLVAAVQHSDALLRLENLSIDSEGLGNVRGQGEFYLHDNMAFDQNYEGSLLDFINGHIEFSELPMMVQLSLAEMVSGDLPWRLEWQHGELLINGEPLNLMAQ